MSGEMQGPVLEEVKAAIECLQKLNVPFSGPFITPKDDRIFIVYDYIVRRRKTLWLSMRQGK